MGVIAKQELSSRNAESRVAVFLKTVKSKKMLDLKTRFLTLIDYPVVTEDHNQVSGNSCRTFSTVASCFVVWEPPPSPAATVFSNITFRSSKRM